MSLPEATTEPVIESPVAKAAESVVESSSERIDRLIHEEVQRREQTRLITLFFFFAVLAVLSLVRQLLGCENMQGWTLASRLGLLMIGNFYCSRMLFVVSKANAAERPVKPTYWRRTTAFELLLVLTMIGISEYLSPKERSIDDLSAPVLLLIPLLIVLSVMRLRPRNTLWIGMIGAGFHAGLSLYAFLRSDEKFTILPTVLTFSVMLLILGVAGSVAASELLNLARGVRRELHETAS